MATLGVDRKELWFLILQHLHKSPFESVARQLDEQLTARSLLPTPAREPGTPLHLRDAFSNRKAKDVCAADLAHARGVTLAL